ncbi:unnamed protein product [Brassica oleracea var. botrytis]
MGVTPDLYTHINYFFTRKDNPETLQMHSIVVVHELLKLLQLMPSTIPHSHSMFLDAFREMGEVVSVRFCRDMALGDRINLSISPVSKMDAGKDVLESYSRGLTMFSMWTKP